MSSYRLAGVRPSQLQLGDQIKFDDHWGTVCAPAPYACPVGIVVTVEWYELSDEGSDTATERVEDYAVFETTHQFVVVRPRS